MINPSTLAWLKAKDGLLPAIIQDARTGQILMLGYMNQEALIITLKTQRTTFYCRSRNCLWEKGETSGNTLKMVSAAQDCDSDTLLIRVIPTGPTCHTGERSCFGIEESPLETIGFLIETIKDRSLSKNAKSYTNQLLDGGIDAYGAKVLEEVEEVVRAANQEGKQRTIEEAADVLYHLLVLLRGEGIEIDDVTAELRRRRK